jgi:hypothetical protein
MLMKERATSLKDSWVQNPTTFMFHIRETVTMMPMTAIVAAIAALTTRVKMSHRINTQYARVFKIGLFRTITCHLPGSKFNRPQVIEQSFQKMLKVVKRSMKAINYV